MTREESIMMFNKPTSWTFRDWENSKAYRILRSMPSGAILIPRGAMTKTQKAKHPEHVTVCGYLKRATKRDRQKWWNNLSNADKKVIMSLPNFSPIIFQKCTDIDCTK